ncbi:MAG TPA: hypothetical protein VI318_03875, partial [Baekduia sp.]
REPGHWRGLDAVVALGADVDLTGLEAPALVAFGAEPASSGATPEPITLADDTALARPLRAVKLHDAFARSAPGLAASTAAALSAATPRILAAGADGRALWATSSPDGLRRDRVAVLPAELGPAEALRERLIPGRSLALLAVATLLREVTAARSWSLPAPRAAFVLDDPNLHWPTYGHVDYESLRAHAAEHHHHVAIATVPLDGWLVHRRAARAFRDGARELSLCVHGNDHTGPELWDIQNDEEAVAAAAQALRRIQALERRAGVPVSRVMVPPHEKVSRSSARALMALGYEAVCNTRPYPWAREIPTEGPHWLARPADAGPLTGWHAVDVVGEGLPVLLRAGFEHPREDLALRAFLGQTLILYGHQEDLRDGLDVLEEGAKDINKLGDVAWGPLDALSRAGVQTLRDGATLHVRPLARRVRVEVPEGVDTLVVDRRAFAPASAAQLEVDGRVTDGERMTLATAGASAEVELSLGAATPAAANGIAAPPRRMWPLVRRVAVELRDRADPVRTRVQH